MMYNLLRPKEKVVPPHVVNLLRNADHSSIGDEIRVSAPNSRLEATQVRTSSSGWSELRDSTSIAKKSLSRGSRPCVSWQASDFKQDPVTHDLCISCREAIPATKSENHVCLRQRRSLQDPAKIRSIAEDDQEVLRTVAM